MDLFYLLKEDVTMLNTTVALCINHKIDPTQVGAEELLISLLEQRNRIAEPFIENWLNSKNCSNCGTEWSGSNTPDICPTCGKLETWQGLYRGMEELCQQQQERALLAEAKLSMLGTSYANLVYARSVKIDQLESELADLRHDIERHVKIASDLATELEAARKDISGRSLMLQIMQDKYEAERKAREGFSKECALLAHKIITCGVAADHSNADLTKTGAYATKWNSPQAESVRKLRQRAESAERKLAEGEAQAIERCAEVAINAVADCEGTRASQYFVAHAIRALSNRTAGGQDK